MAQHVTAFAIEILRLVVWLGLLAAIFAPMEQLFALRRRPGRLATVPADVAFYFLNSLLPIAILAPPLAVIAAVVRSLTPEAYVASVAGLPLWAKLAAGLLVSELGGYWGHRWSHEIPLLWRFHVLHHAPGHIDWLI